LKPCIPTLGKEKQNPIPFKEMGSKFNSCPYPPHGSEIISQGLAAWRKGYKLILKMSRRIKKNFCNSDTIRVRSGGFGGGRWLMGERLVETPR